MNRIVLQLPAILLVPGLWSLPSGAAEPRPNIIVFMADDMGYANHPFCGPSRAALLSGRYQPEIKGLK